MTCLATPRHRVVDRCRIAYSRQSFLETDPIPGAFRHVYGDVLVAVLVVQRSCACVRTVMAGWHGCNHGCMVSVSHRESTIRCPTGKHCVGNEKAQPLPPLSSLCHSVVNHMIRFDIERCTYQKRA